MVDKKTVWIILGIIAGVVILFSLTGVFNSDDVKLSPDPKLPATPECIEDRDCGSREICVEEECVEQSSCLYWYGNNVQVPNRYGNTPWGYVTECEADPVKCAVITSSNSEIVNCPAGCNEGECKCFKDDPKLIREGETENVGGLNITMIESTVNSARMFIDGYGELYLQLGGNDSNPSQVILIHEKYYLIKLLVTSSTSDGTSYSYSIIEVSCPITSP